MNSRCLISGQLPGSHIKRFLKADNVFKKIWVYAVDITELILLKEDLMQLTRQQSIPYSIPHFHGLLCL